MMNSSAPISAKSSSFKFKNVAQKTTESRFKLSLNSAGLVDGSPGI